MLETRDRQSEERYRNRWYGKYRAFVRDNNDPERLGRVRLGQPLQRFVHRQELVVIFAQTHHQAALGYQGNAMFFPIPIRLGQDREASLVVALGPQRRKEPRTSGTRAFRRGRGRRWKASWRSSSPPRPHPGSPR